MALALRPARVADAAGIASLSAALGYPADPDRIAARLTRLLAREDQRILVGMLDQDLPAGWIHGAVQEPLESGPVCEILGLVVAERARGQGIGRALVEAIGQWARELGLPLSVRSNVTRLESHPFYERLGFVRVKTQHAYRRTPAAGGA